MQNDILCTYRCPFYNVPDRGNLQEMSQWMQGFYPIKVPYTGTLRKGLPVVTLTTNYKTEIL